MKRFFAKIVRLAILVLRHSLKLFVRLERKLDIPFDEASHYQSVIRSTHNHDMAADHDEKFYAEQYWHIIQPALESWRPIENGNYLDLGCGQGRFSKPLAQWCASANAQVTGVDISEHAIETANKDIDIASNLKFEVADIHQFINSKENEVDGIFFMEVAFFLPNLKSFLESVAKALKPGAFFIASFRSQYFNALSTLQNGMWDSVSMLLEKDSGRLWNSDTEFNWHSSQALVPILKGLGLELKTINAIGSCSGITGDPLSLLAQPSKLNTKERNQLMQLEMKLSESIPDAGRYMLIVAQKSQ